MLEMRDMRHRTKPSYVALNSDDEIDDVPILNSHKIREMPVKKSPFCAKCCFFFSILAILFLSIVGYLLWIDSLYLKVSAENQKNKPNLVNGVLGAMVMYVGCVVFSGYLWFKSPTIDDAEIPRFDD